MKIIKFAAELVPLIISGEKKSTWRLFDDKELSDGDELEFVNKENGEVFGYANIINVREKNLGNICESDYDGHEKFPNKESMLKTYKGYYGEKVDDETVVKIIQFSFISK